VLKRVGCRVRSKRWTRGAGVVEFALVAPLFLFVVFGLVDLGRATMLYNSVASAAHEGARFGMVLRDASWGTNFASAGNGNSAGTYGPNITAYLAAGYENTIVGQVARRAGALDLTRTSVTIAVSTKPDRGDELTVTVGQAFSPIAGSFLGIGPITVSASSTVLLE